MPLNRRRFVFLSGLALSGAAATASSCSPSDQSASASDSSFTTSSTPYPRTSSTASYLHAPAPAGLYAPERGDIRLAIISDLNSAYGSTDYRQEVIDGVAMLPDWQPDMVLCAGDMVAGQSINLSATEIEAMWMAFDEKILFPIRAARLPFAMTIGNHDASSYKSDGEFVYVLDRQETQKYWSGHQFDTDLTFVEASGFPFYYSFRQNDIFYLTWDASSANIPPEQVAWADRALSSPEARSARLRIVMGHLPLYAVSQRRDRPGEYLNQADELRLLLERHSVHTYITGHHHAYFPGKVGQLNMLHCGALGSGPRSLLTTPTAAYQTLTIMDIFLEATKVVYTTYNMNTKEVVDLEQLPRQIVGPNGRELRQDIHIEELTPAEYSQPYVPSEA
ncbi:Ser/Thr protein phosphatase family protein [Synechococcus sp. PCC 7335]|uniref:metallophosphoesterase family protein n=1 Tax=Synechococcus sp. (strain ATCC 29403 / PCC 7335) TaxID=91464 RepID=UPI00017EB423|nr:metallophosphoesterase [Synechococcus sp. PCC 7335]EDX85576.1 Ser/Thr protein phosphatase family protein [Synechococcus sp. PCC 7335]